MRFAVAALFLYLSLCAWAQSPTDVARGSISGLGFTVTLPDAVEMDVAPTTDLAFGLNLTEPTHGREWNRLPPRFIGVATQWNSEAGSLDAEVRRMTADLHNLIPADASDGEVRLSSMFPAKLGDLPARRLVVEFKNRQKKPAVRQIVVAYRSRPDASAIVYIATLTTTRADFPQDLNVFAKVLAGFKLTPVE
jgi:hypothetical protein